MKLGFLRGTVLSTLGLVTAGLILSSCKPDIILPPPRGIDGDYQGLLIISRSPSLNAPLETDTDHVIVTLRLDDPKEQSAGSYSHRFDSLTTDTNDVPDFCDIPRGDWIIKNQKLIFTPGNVGVSTCDETLVPTSEIEGAGGTITEIPFGFVTVNTEPSDQDIGDSLIVSQDRLADNITTVFELALTAIP